MRDTDDRDDVERMADGTYRVRCMSCGASVSSPLAAPVIMRAWVICPECIERYGLTGSWTGRGTRRARAKFWIDARTKD